MHLTVGICTWNRASLLAQTLEHMTALQAPRHVTWELLVIDNNSTDDTAAVVASFEGRLPVRHVFEPTPGKSNALNLGAREASGVYILWTDDDVHVEPTWLSAYVETFIRRPAAAVFGGVIRPWFPQDPPEWLRRGFNHVSSAFGALDYGPKEMLLTSRHVPFGANMAVRTAEQRAFPYDPSIGMRPGRKRLGEETEMVRRMIASGIEGWWVPGAIVRHFVPAEKQSAAWVRAFYMGYGEYLAQTGERANAPRLFGKPRWMWSEAIRTEARYRFERVFQSPEQWVPSLRDASVMWGRILHS
jgi:glycosyltransferase involved in cell wall biosynthesis